MGVFAALDTNENTDQVDKNEKDRWWGQEPEFHETLSGECEEECSHEIWYCGGKLVLNENFALDWGIEFAVSQWMLEEVEKQDNCNKNIDEAKLFINIIIAEIVHKLV